MARIVLPARNAMSGSIADVWVSHDMRRGKIISTLSAMTASVVKKNRNAQRYLL